MSIYDFLYSICTQMAKKKITTITSDDESQTSADWISQETENKKETIKDILCASKEDIIKTISFKLGVAGWEGSEDILIESLKKIDVSWLKDVVFVDLTARFNEQQYMQQMNGIEIVLDELQKDSEKKIIIFTPLKFDTLRILVKRAGKEDKFTLIQNSKNVRFFEYLDDPKNLEHIFDEDKSNQEWWDVGSETAFQKVLEEEISYFLHDAGHWTGDKPEISALPYEKKLEYFFSQPEESKSEERIAFENRMISLLQFQHPDFKSLPKKNNLLWIIVAYKHIKSETLPEWTRFEWVFVDRDGTLYDNDTHQFNQKVIDMVHEYEGQGKEIIIWTLGDVEIKQKILNDAGLPYKVKSKLAYKWAIVEIAIDNESAASLFANATVRAENYIKI